MVLMKSSVTSPSKIGTAKNENNPLEKFKKKWEYNLLQEKRNFYIAYLHLLFEIVDIHL